MFDRSIRTTLAAVLSSAALVCAAGAEPGFSETGAAISVTDGDNVVLTYHKAEVDPPQGADPAYRRCGYHEAPQRMRIWPPTSHNGAVFFNFVPIQENPWWIGADGRYWSRYRLVLSDAALDPKTIDAAWDSYTKQK